MGEHKVNKEKKTPIDSFGPVTPGWKTFTHSHPGVQASEDFQPVKFPHTMSPTQITHSTAREFLVKLQCECWVLKSWC